jgi:hypothetical protein
MMQCVANGHEIVALANLKPSKESGKGTQFSSVSVEGKIILIMVTDVKI